MKATALLLALMVPALSQAAREGFAEVSGARIFYSDSGGSGPPVVFLHAATGSIPMWEHQGKAVTAAGFRFIAYDRRGSGKTEVTAGGPPGTAADDLAALLDFLKIERAHVVGTAAGGFTALDFALAFPNRIRGLVIACTIGGIQDEDYQKFGQWMRPPAFDPLPPEMKELGPTYRAADRKGAERWMALEHQSRPPGPRPPAQAMKNRLTLDAMAKIGAPTLAIAGGADLYAPPAVMQMFTSRIKNSKFVTIPDSGHSAYWENPDAFNKAVIDFLRRLK